MAEVAYDSYMNDSLGGVGGAGEGGYMDEYQAYGTQYSQQKQGDYVDDGEDVGEITQQGCWEIITAFFEENGLVQQQLSSFNEFVSNTVQELVEESKSLTLEQSDQHTGLEGDISVSYKRARWRWEQTLTAFVCASQRRFEIEFGQIYLAKPSITESDGQSLPLMPQEARLRNLTWVEG